MSNKENNENSNTGNLLHQKVDMVVLNGKVYTADSANPIVEAFAIKDGKFVAIGSSEYINSHFDGEETVYANNMALLPGLIDAHCHFYSLGRMKSQADLNGTLSFKEVIEHLIEFSKTNKSPWIVGRGWDQNDWNIKEFPVNDTLNLLFPNTPVYISRVDGHAALVNNAALKIARINTKSKIKGGDILLNNGKLTGILLDNAADSVRAKIPKPDAREMYKYLIEAQRECFKYGLTTVDDAGQDKDVIDLMDLMQKKGLLKIRVYAMLNPTQENKEYYYKTGFYKTDHLNIRSFKLFADGALGSRGAALRAPYSDRPNESGFLLHDSDYYYKQCKDIYKHGFQVNTHCIGDLANHFMLELYSKILPEHNDLRWRIEHAQVISPEDFNIFKKYSIIPSVQPTHATSDMYWAEDRLGPVRIKTAYAYQDLLKEVGMIADGSDFPVESANPLLGFYAAVSRKDVKGFPKDGFQSENALTRQQALYAMTIWAAYANFEENEKGSIKVGKFADFVILKKDIMQVPLDEIPTTEVYSTYVGGEKVK